ncbi:hypothetical protein PF003_g36106 [Phytophthora fragariae]|nr:hypothetical protein PF003_g36106 [Phytophthora fragariae]
MRRPAWRGSRMSDGTWTVCETACGICLGSLNDEAGRLRTRCSQSEESDALARQSFERHLDWIRTLYDRVGSLEAQEARRVAARARARAPAPAQLPSEELVRMMANAFQPYSATQSAPQAQQPPPGDRA